jgi:hypothetical protein
LYYKNGVLTSRNYDSFDTEEKVYQTITDTMSNGVLTMSECTAFSTKGLPVQKNTNKYDASGNVTSIEIVYYDANGKPIRR